MTDVAVVTEAPPTTDEPEEIVPPEKIWMGRPVDYKEITYGQMRKVRDVHKVDPETALMMLLTQSFYYTDDQKMVFQNGLADVEALPAKWTNILVSHANASFRLNLPEAVPPGPNS